MKKTSENFDYYYNYYNYLEKRKIKKQKLLKILILIAILLIFAHSMAIYSGKVFAFYLNCW